MFLFLAQILRWAEDQWGGKEDTSYYLCIMWACVGLPPVFGLLRSVGVLHMTCAAEPAANLSPGSSGLVCYLGMEVFLCFKHHSLTYREHGEEDRENQIDLNRSSSPPPPLSNFQAVQALCATGSYDEAGSGR